MADIYSPNEPIYGKGTQLRVAILALGAATTRPLDAAFKLIKGATTSEIKGGQDTKDIPVDYDTAVDEDFADSSPGSRNWSLTLSVNTKANQDQMDTLEDLWDAWAAGQFVYIERLKPNDTKWRGGLAYVVDPSEPAAADGVITFACGFTGKGSLKQVAAT
jgi:hypothetical protein